MTAAPPPFPVLIDRERLLARIAELALALDDDHRDTEDIVFVCVVEGARVFCRHLMAAMKHRPEVVEIRARSYLSGTERAAGDVTLSGHDEHEFAGRSVVIVEDIVDTGHTVKRLREHLVADGAARVDVVTLLTKPARREVDVDLGHVGFEIEDRFVIGFGMDVDGRYRDLPHVAVYDPALETGA